jgi:hypothetical protein
MSTIHASANSIVAAPADRVYAILSDYTTHHPQILPSNFSDLRVEEGGVGDGTVLSFRMRLGGKTSDFRQRVSEPQPGRVLTETDLTTGAETSFLLIPEADDRTRVAINTRFPNPGGLTGLVQQLVAPRMLKKLYEDELRRLDDYAQSATI